MNYGPLAFTNYSDSCVTSQRILKTLLFVFYTQNVYGGKIIYCDPQVQRLELLVLVESPKVLLLLLVHDNVHAGNGLTHYTDF